MIIHRSIMEMVPLVDVVKQGKWNGFAYVLIGGSGYMPTDFNHYDVPKTDQFYRKFHYETEWPKINFQQNLSEDSLAFAFDRPTDILNHDLYNNTKHKHIYIATETDLTIRSTAEFIKGVLDHHKIKPPYRFVVFSEGGFDVMCFHKYFSELVQDIYFIDTPFLEKYMVAFDTYRGNLPWMKDVLRRKYSWNGSLDDLVRGFGASGEDLSRKQLEKIDAYNFEIKTHNVIFKLKMSDVPKQVTCYFLLSPYLDNPTKKDKTKIKILKAMHKHLKYDNAKMFWVNAPHQIERTLPISLARFIVSTKEFP